MKIGKNLLKYRSRLGKTQEEVANLIGVTKKAYGFWENDGRQPSFETLDKLALIFDVPVPDFFKDFENENVNKPLLDKVIDELIEDGTLSKDAAIDKLDPISAQLLDAALKKYIQSKVK